jgi:hypothetical protein
MQAQILERNVRTKDPQVRGRFILGRKWAAAESVA